MRTFETTVSREELLAKLRTNRESHRKDFEETLKEYQEAVLKELELLLKRASLGLTIQVKTGLILPQDHTNDYDCVINMVEMHQETTIVLDGQTFSQYVRDEWDWKDQFQRGKMSNSVYTQSLR